MATAWHASCSLILLMAAQGDTSMLALICLEAALLTAAPWQQAQGFIHKPSVAGMLHMCAPAVCKAVPCHKASRRVCLILYNAQIDFTAAQSQAFCTEHALVSLCLASSVQLAVTSSTKQTPDGICCGPSSHACRDKSAAQSSAQSAASCNQHGSHLLLSASSHLLRLQGRSAVPIHISCSDCPT